jgi:hypothetical protein
MKQALKQLFPDMNIIVIKNQQDWQKFLLWIQSNQREWILSNDDLGRYLAEEYLHEQKTSVNSYFLRWDRPAVELAHNQKNTNVEAEKILVDRVIDQDGLEKEMMEKAFIQANYSNDWWAPSRSSFCQKR